MGPVEAINTLSRNSSKNDFEMFIIASKSENLSSASTAPESGPGSKVNQRVVPTHYYDPKNPMEGIPSADVLIVPGGLGPPDQERPAVVDFIKQYYNKHLKGNPNRYLFTVCTGSDLAAQAGCLYGVYATTNKTAYPFIVKKDYAQDTYWVAKARWVDDSTHNIWTTSGVSAGTDGMIAWMRKVYGQDTDTVFFFKKVSDGMEWIAAQSHTNDPFAYDHQTGKPLEDHPGNTAKLDKPLVKPTWESS